MKLKKTLAPWEKSYDKPRQHVKKPSHYFADKGQSNQIYGFSSSHVWMWELDHKESWACHKKESIWVSPNEVDEPRVYYTELTVK